jgi:hypothetical protein
MDNGIKGDSSKTWVEFQNHSTRKHLDESSYFACGFEIVNF